MRDAVVIELRLALCSRHAQETAANTPIPGEEAV
jgi:hypothetical protein